MTTLVSYTLHILKKWAFYRNFLMGCFVFLSLGFTLSYALDVISSSIKNQSATSPGSYNSEISFLTGAASYINKNNDSDIIENYFTGAYYDSQFEFFQLNWSTDTTKNVRIIGTTGKCSSGYGYKLGWFAYNDQAGFVRFDFSDSLYVYYCQSDKKLHGYAYSEHIGFQNFEWIGFEIDALSLSTSAPQTTGTSQSPSTGVTSTIFTNDTSLILTPTTSTSTSSSLPEDSTIQWKWLAKKEWQEIFFSIIK